jgi:asparagine synthase (glutamine-hydrolysing)
MCGIGGELRFDGHTADPGGVEPMVACLEPRGPDSGGAWHEGPAALVHRRLKIIDLSEAGSQPMVDEELGLVLVFNGCIYNYRDLRAELAGHGYHFFSTSDSEVVIKAYHRWGIACVDRFRGMFAFGLYERDSGRLVLARDRLGIKPIYLSQTGARVRFASTLQAVVAAGDVDTTVDPVALHHYLSFHSVVPPPRTILRGVGKLPPATVRVIEPDGSHRDTRYWDVDFTRGDRAGLTADEWREALLDCLRQAVDRRTVADVPVGVLLSGGLDSSLVVALLAERGQPGLTTFSIGFDTHGGERGDEFAYSDLMAERFGTDHHRIHIDTARLGPALAGAISAMSEPMVSHDVVAFYLLSQEVSKHVKVVQSGQGADEVFAGYSWYPPLADVPLDRAPQAYAAAFVDRSHAELNAALQPRWRLDDDVSRQLIAEHMTRPGADTSVDAALRLDSQVMLVDDPVKRVDNMTMSWGLEARVPFLDADLIELAAACPPELKLADDGKGILKAASRGVVPDEIIDRTKGYFPVPAIRHMSGPVLEQVTEALRGPAARERGLFDERYIADLLAEPNESRTTLGANALWQFALLELWLQDLGVG